MEQQLLQEQKKPNALAFQVSAIFSLYYLILVFVMRSLNINLQSPDAPTAQKVISTILIWGVFISAIFFAQNKHKRELGGYITFGRAFSAGFKVAAYAGLFISILMLLYYQFIDPGAIDEVMEVAIKQAKGDQKQLTGIQMMVPYMGMITAFYTGILFAFSGLVVSPIIAAIIKKERPESFESPT